MQRIQNVDEIKALHTHQQADEIYLYAMQAPSKENVQGDMSLGSQYGFLFGNPTAKTIAHEIAHGYFQLEHTFDDKYKLTQGSTNNLMDYGNGTQLNKFQWDL